MDGSGGKECSVVCFGLVVLDQWLGEEFVGVSWSDYPMDGAAMDLAFRLGRGGWGI